MIRFFAIAAVWFAAALAVLFSLPAPARDGVDWDAVNSPEIRQWYRELKQPDNPSVSCCGEADAWWADSFGVDENGGYAIITDDRDDVPLGRRHIDSGTKIYVPTHKYNRDNNPTGHGVIFIGPANNVLCYIVPGGV